MKTILVTGGAGYIGSIVARRLSEKGYEVVIYDNLSRGNKGSLPKDIPFIQGDIDNEKVLLQVFKKYDVQAIMHFAAYAYVGESVDNPSLYFENNLRKSLSFLEIVRKGSIKKFIFSSSCAAYGIPEKVPITENEKRSPINPYGLSKILLERALQVYDYSYGIKHVIFRYFNAAGAAYGIGEGHDPETHLIPLVLQACQEKKTVQVFGNDYPTPDGTCIRDYVHVLDLADAHIAALSYLEKNDSNCFNLATGKGMSNLEIIRLCEQVSGKKLKINFTPRRAGDPPVLFAKAEKARKELNWTPKYSMKEIIESAWEWHKKNPKGF